MPIHDWKRVEAGVFHAFHHGWIEEISRVLNSGLLPEDYYALPEQHAAGFGPDVLTLERVREDENAPASPPSGSSRTGGLIVAEPTLAPTAETDLQFYRRKQTSIAVRHVTGDRMIAVVEILSPGNKSTRHAVRSFVEKAADFLDHEIHLLIVDVLPPGPRDPEGIHALIWDAVAGQEYSLPPDRPLTLASYEADLSIRAYVRPTAIGGVLDDLPLFLCPNGCVTVPLNLTYEKAYAAMPRRWQRVLDA